jgi:MFS family permease
MRRLQFVLLFLDGSSGKVERPALAYNAPHFQYRSRLPSMAQSDQASIATLFQLPDFRRLLVANACSTLASRALAVVVGYQVYALTKSPFSLGYLGLVEAIPALSLALYGGHVADRYNRRSILRLTLGTLVTCSATIAGLATLRHQGLSLISLYAAVFVAGIARGFAEPAIQAWEAQIIPQPQMVQAAALMSSIWLTCAVLGPVFGGIALATVGPSATFGGFAVLFSVSWISVTRMQASPVVVPPAGESIWQSITEGVRYVVTEQVLVGSMALDLFAVLFGGAVAILPIFASDILHVGPVKLGLLNASPHAGALITMLIATRYPPIRHAGRNLLVAVAGFGVCMIVFANSTNFWLSLAVLAGAGVCDGVSVVIRRSIVRLLSPKHMRGRIAAVGMVFIGASNELGALESGLAAGWLGTVRSVWAGGLLTLAVVTLTAIKAPRLRHLRLDVIPNVEESHAKAE